MVKYDAVVQNACSHFCGKWNGHKISRRIWWQQKKPNRKITINDLELAGALLGLITLETKGLPLTYTHLATFCYNMTMVAWEYKSRTSKSKIDGYLLQFLVILIHQAQASIMILRQLTGVINIMADIISRAFKLGQLFVAPQHGIVPYFNEHPHLT